MVDILGPADAIGAVVSRPADDRTFGSVDTFFIDCSNSEADDGTDVRASWLNGITAALRSLWRGNGKRADNVTPVVPENGSSDDGLLLSVQQLIQRGQTRYGVATGTANSLVVTLLPALVEYKAGLDVMVSVPLENTGPAVANFNGLGDRPIVRRDGSPLQRGDLIGGGALALLGYDGAKFTVLSHLFDRPTLTVARTYYVKASAPGNDANDGLSAGTPFATWQKAFDTVQKLNLNGYQVIIQGLGGTYSQGAIISGPFFGGGTVLMQGTGDTIAVPAGSSILVMNNGELSVGGGITVQSSDPANCGLTAQFGGLINVIGAIRFGACAGAHMQGIDGGQIRLRSNYFVDGGALAHMSAASFGRVAKDTSGPVAATFANGTTFTIATVLCQRLGFVSMIGYTWSGIVTGQRYLCTLNSVIDTSGGGASFLPGSSAGASGTGGQYN